MSSCLYRADVRDVLKNQNENEDEDDMDEEVLKEEVSVLLKQVSLL
jgi:hypothetical protein